MEKLLVLALAAACGVASAQTPASNPMPDGSRDMYLGLGGESRPRYEGAGERTVSTLPVLQVQWSSGIFISGMSAGMHLSDDPTIESGPLLAIQPRRTASGTGTRAGGVEGIMPQALRAPGKGLEGMDEIGARLQGGAFFNYYLAPQWRLTSSALYGAGNERNGALLELGLQRLAARLAPHHTLSLSAGIALANASYNQAFFGIGAAEAERSRHPEYHVAGGLKDAHIGAHWNWALSPGWLLTSSLQATHLADGASHSPLVERPTNLTVSTAIAWRF